MCSGCGTARVDVLVETGAGDSAWFPDAEYAAAGAGLVGRQELHARADVVLCVQPPADADRVLLRPGQVLLGLLQPLIDPQLAAALAVAEVTAISLDGLPRTVSRAQSMDALSSQANVAGYKAALLAADTYSNYLPMFMTAAGTTRPALVLVIGAGVAGLQAIGTARRLGAVVTGYDVRDAARGDVLSTGATFLDLGVQVSAVGEGGYARELTGPGAARPAGRADRRDRPVRHRHHHRPGTGSTAPAAGVGHRAGRDAGRIGGHRPRIQRPGRERRGFQARPDVVTANGVTVVGAANLPSAVPKAASTAYSRNVCALLAHLIHDGQLAVDPADEITAGVLITHGGQVVHPAVRALLTGGPAPSSPHRVHHGHNREGTGWLTRHRSPLFVDLTTRRAGPARPIRGDRQGPGDPAPHADARRQRHPRRPPEPARSSGVDV